MNQGKALFVLSGEMTTPPMSIAARREAGYLLRLLQSGEKLSLPVYRPMPAVGPRCGELRIVDEDKTWRIMVRLDSDAVLVVEVFAKKTQQTPASVINNCKARLKRYDTAARSRSNDET